MMYEYLTRACVICYLYDHEGDRAALKRMRYDINNGFPALEGLVELLQEYKDKRETYPRLDDFIPELVEYFEQYALSYN